MGDETWVYFMILRPGFRVVKGNHPVLLVRKKRVNQNPTSR